MIKTARQLIEVPQDLAPHIVVLGAGASLAAFPNGDANNKKLPLMENFVKTVGLESLLCKAEIRKPYENFEVIYSKLKSDPNNTDLVEKIEQHIYKYFSELSLPRQVTLYDQLLLSLRPKDIVFTFNWDPFLFDAYKRNRDAVPLPEIFFLHGNVRIGACLEHDKFGQLSKRCPECLKLFTRVPLLYPVERKDYSTNPYTRRSWEAAKILFKEAFTLTIFGYGAPDSDIDAVELLKLAWFDQSSRSLEHIEIIDTAPQSDLYKRWKPFTPTGHIRTKEKFIQSRLVHWPRRSCESIIFPMSQGQPCEDFPLPDTNVLKELQTFAENIAQHENKTS